MMGCGAKPSPKEEQQQMMMHKRADRWRGRELMIMVPCLGDPMMMGV
jgi:hypothetical protein